MRIGLRVWKTAIAVAVSIGICRLLGLQQPVFAGVAAVICVQPTVVGSVRKGAQRMQATLIGAGFAVAALTLLVHVTWFVPLKPVIVGVVVLLVMVTTIKLKWNDSLVLAAATVVVIMVLPNGENIYHYAATRTIITLVGVVVATAVNALVFPPEYARSIRCKLVNLWATAQDAYRMSVDSFCQRDAALAREVIERLSSTEEAYLAAATERQWLEEESCVLNLAARGRGDESPQWTVLLDCLSGMRQAASRIAGITESMLEDSPHYSEHDARVYDIVRDYAEAGFAVAERIRSRIEGEQMHPGQVDGPDETSMRPELVKAMRAAYQAPKDIFSLVDVATVAHEVNMVNDILDKADRALGRV